MLFLHIHTDSVHHHLCKADHADHKEKPEGKSSRHSECPICLQFILVLGKYIIEPTFVIENLAEIAYRISIPFSVTISSSHHQSIRPRSPPCG